MPQSSERLQNQILSEKQRGEEGRGELNCETEPKEEVKKVIVKGRTAKQTRNYHLDLCSSLKWRIVGKNEQYKIPKTMKSTVNLEKNNP